MTTPSSYIINDCNASNNPIVGLLMFYILCVSTRFVINLICKYTGMFNKQSTSELDEEANILVPIDSGDQRDFLMTVVRHGKSTYANEDDGGALTDLGELQAEKVGLRLANINFDLIISSYLARARETAEIIVKENKYKNKQLTICKTVRERDYGVLQPFIFWIAKGPLYTGYSHLGHWINIPGVGESVDDLEERVRQFLLNLQLAVNDLDVEDPQVLVVSHASFLTEMHNVLTGERLEACENTAVLQYQIKGVYRTEDGTWGVEQVECVIKSCHSHLKSIPDSTFEERDIDEEIGKFVHDVEDTFSHINEDMIKFGDNLKEEISKAGTDMKEKLDDINEDMVKFGHNIEDTFVHACEEIIKFDVDMKEDISRVATNIKEALDAEDTFGHINEDMIKFGDNFKNEISKVGTDMKEKVNHIEVEIGKFFHNIEDTFIHADEEIKNVGDDVKENISRVWTDIKEGFDYVSKEMCKLGEDKYKKSKEACNIDVLLEDGYKEKANYWVIQEDECVNADKDKCNEGVMLDEASIEEVNNGTKMEYKCKEKSNDEANLEVDCDSEIKISVEVTGGKLVKLDAQSNQ